jgi:hypothetical protein
VEKRCEHAKIIDYGLPLNFPLKLARTPETRWLLQGELKAIKDGCEYGEGGDEDSTYRGYVNQDGEPEGVGIEIFNNGNKYSGEYKGGYRNGVIKAEFADGDIIWGMFKDGEPNGYNTFQYNDGTKYTGQCKNGDSHGYGIDRYTAGATYHGQWNEDKREGYAIYKSPNNDEYDG